MLIVSISGIIKKPPNLVKIEDLQVTIRGLMIKGTLRNWEFGYENRNLSYMGLHKDNRF